jgi:hypothetical protein
MFVLCVVQEGKSHDNKDKEVWIKVQGNKNKKSHRGKCMFFSRECCLLLGRDHTSRGIITDCGMSTECD